MATRIKRFLLYPLAVIVGIVVIVVVYISLSWDKKVSDPAPDISVVRDSSAIARGEYIYKYGTMCWQCHSDGREGGNSTPSGGQKFDLTTLSPSLGSYYASNITPDVESGIGAWTDGEVLRALKRGISRDGRILFPIMPVTWLKEASDDDLLAVIAYLRSLPAVKNVAPEREPSFFVKTLFTFGVFGPEPPATEAVRIPPQADTLAYGRYLLRARGLCADCHTPRNLQDGAFYFDSLFSGSSIAFGFDDGAPTHAYATNLTPDRETGIGKYTLEQFMNAMRFGMRPDSTIMDGHMPYSYFGLWLDYDIEAMYHYLRTVPPIRRTTPAVFRTSRMTEGVAKSRGEAIFTAYCESCHGHNGLGAPPTGVKMSEVAPSLSDDELGEFIMAGNIGLRMPPFGKTLQKDELDAVLAFIRSWPQE